MVQENILREHLFTVIMDKISTETDRREEALADFFAVTGAVANARADKVAELVPPILSELYSKWVNMFLDRLFETVPVNQLKLIADGSEQNNAAAVLAYIMFLESERMEKQIAADLKEYSLDHSSDKDTGNLAVEYIRGAMNRVAQSSNAEKEAKAYKKRKG